jgi:hypothetical protein
MRVVRRESSDLDQVSFSCVSGLLPSFQVGRGSRFGTRRKFHGRHAGFSGGSSSAGQERIVDLSGTDRG